MARKTVSIEEARQLLGIGRTLAYAAARRGELPALRIGRRVVVPVAAIERLLGERRREDIEERVPA